MYSEKSAHVQHDSSSEVEKLRRELKLALEHRKAWTMYDMKSMTSEFMRGNGRSEPGSAGDSVALGESPAEVGTIAVGESPRGTIPTAEVRETTAAVGAGIGRSASGSVEGSAAVGESPQGVAPTVYETLQEATIRGCVTVLGVIS